MLIIGKKIIIICPEHGEFYQQPMRHLNGCGCPKCNGGVSYTLIDFVNISNEKHNFKYDYSDVVYINCYTPVKIRCKKHGYFYQKPTNHIGGCGCPKCNQSRLENKVEKLLIDNNIKYTYNISNFDWLKNKRKMRLDFYLPDYNIAIECQGIQHFKNINFFKYSNYLKFDMLKLKLCSEHGVKILYFADCDYVPYDWKYYEVIKDLDILLQKIRE